MKKKKRVKCTAISRVVRPKRSLFQPPEPKVFKRKKSAIAAAKKLLGKYYKIHVYEMYGGWIAAVADYGEIAHYVAEEE